MKKMIAAALLALAVTGSAFVPVGSSAFAQTNEQPGQLVPNEGTMMEEQDSQDYGLSNIPSTPDNNTQNDSPQPEPSKG